MNRESLVQKWFPIASSSDLVKRHVYHAQLLGREFAVWRADDGNVNVWENRCLHRGVRLSIGINDGTELVCQYHGWRYANRTAGCTYIPAHPADAPSRTICNNTYPVKEFLGLVWTGEEAIENEFCVEVIPKKTVLRAVSISASMDAVSKGLINAYSDQKFPVNLLKNGSIEVDIGHKRKILFFIQPMDSNLSIVRGVLNQDLAQTERYNFLKDQNFFIEGLRCKIEDEFKGMTVSPMVPHIKPVSEELSKIPSSTKHGRKADLRVEVFEKAFASTGVVTLKLRSIKEQLPTFQPGAHIDLHLPNGLVRQYSLINGPGETDYYQIGVKLEKESTGGSENIHKSLKVGDILATSEPRNNFPLRRDSVQTIFIAGGIGITPILSMSQALKSMGLSFELHYFVQNEDEISFKEILKKFEKNVIIYTGLSPQDTMNDIKGIISKPGHAKNLYVCGPGPMLEATLKLASELNWLDEAVHFEYFKNTKEVDNSSNFEIELARSALTLEVPSGRTILEILRDNGVVLPSSCEQGACGTCKVNVLKGKIDHQDVYLNATEKADGNVIMTCVSRAHSNKLILDI
jgi:ferredoxin-NADP reductase/nitrite reductase/ring-hydroxylating ferredoxin subunit